MTVLIPQQCSIEMQVLISWGIWILFLPTSLRLSIFIKIKTITMLSKLGKTEQCSLKFKRSYCRLFKKVRIKANTLNFKSIVSNWSRRGAITTHNLDDVGNKTVKGNGRLKSSINSCITTLRLPQPDPHHLQFTVVVELYDDVL